MLDDHSVVRASKSHAEPVEARSCALSGRNREKSSFDGSLDQAPRQARGAPREGPQDDLSPRTIAQSLIGFSTSRNRSILVAHRLQGIAGNLPVHLKDLANNLTMPFGNRLYWHSGRSRL